jgi:hypothetical protein
MAPLRLRYASINAMSSVSTPMRQKSLALVQLVRVYPRGLDHADDAADDVRVGGNQRGTGAVEGQSLVAAAIGRSVGPAGDAVDRDAYGARDEQSRHLQQRRVAREDLADGDRNGRVSQVTARATVRRLHCDDGRLGCALGDSEGGRGENGECQCEHFGSGFLGDESCKIEKFGRAE